MRTNYKALNSDDLGLMYKSLNRKLIPVNFIILIIAVVALICHLWLPVLKIDIKINGDTVSTAMSFADKEAKSEDFYGATSIYALLTSDEQSGEQGGEQGGESGSSGDLNVKEIIKFVSQGIDTKFSINISSLEAVKTGLSGDTQKIRDLIAHKFTNLNEIVTTILNQVSPYIMSYSIGMITEVLGDVLTEAGLDDLPVENVESVLNKLANGETEQAKQEFNDTAKEYYKEVTGNELTQEQLENIDQYFDTVVEYGTDENGKFQITDAMLNLIKEYQSGSSSGGSSSEGSSSQSKVALDTGYAVTTADEGAGNESTGNDMIDMVLEAMEDPSAFVASKLPDDMCNMVGKVLAIAILATVGLSALCWALLALFTFFRLFTKNKRVKMWYVKIFAFIPCLLFALLPWVVITFGDKILNLIPSLKGTEVITKVSEILPYLSVNAAISGVVSGICLALLWIISIFICHPINKKIKACKREIKARA